MTETITKDKTLLVLAFAVTFLAGAAVFGAISDYEAEAKPKKPKPSIPLPPFEGTVNQLDKYQNQLAVIHFNFVEIAEGIENNSPGYTNAEVAILFDELDGIEVEAEEIRDLAEDTKNNIPVI